MALYDSYAVTTPATIGAPSHLTKVGYSYSSRLDGILFSRNYLTPFFCIHADDWLANRLIGLY